MSRSANSVAPVGRQSIFRLRSEAAACSRTRRSSSISSSEKLSGWGAVVPASMRETDSSSLTMRVM